MNMIVRIPILAAALASAAPAIAQEYVAKPTSPSVAILSPATSRTLDIVRIPTPQPVPLIIGHYWTCIEKNGFERCTPVLVVCTNNQETCAVIE